MSGDAAEAWDIEALDDLGDVPGHGQGDCLVVLNAILTLSTWF